MAARLKRVAVTPLGERRLDDWPETIEDARMEEAVLIFPGGLVRSRAPVAYTFRAGRVVYANGDGVIIREYS